MRKSLKTFVSLLMAMAILLSLAVPTALAVNEIKVPISIKLPSDVTAVAGVELEFNYTSGVTFTKWEKSSVLKSASDISTVKSNGNTLSGVFNKDNLYKPTNGTLDLGYLVFDGTTAGQSVTIVKAKFVRVVDKDTTDSRDVTEAMTIKLDSSSSGSDSSSGSSSGSSSSGVVIDGSAVSANINSATDNTAFPFTDVKTTDWFYAEVKGAYNNGLINGITATEYRPNETLTVAQAIKLAAALHQLQNDGKVTLQNGTGNWYSSYVNYAVTNNIIESKYQNYTLAQMNAAITRKEFVHIFHGAMSDYPVKNTVKDNAIPDVKTTDTYGSDIYEFYRAGILVGSNGGYFKPNDAIKRSEVAAILVRMYDASVRQSITLG